MSLEHAFMRLQEVGLSTGALASPNSSDGSSKPSKAVIIGSSVAAGVVLLLAIGGIIYYCIRRSRRRTAYNMVHRGVDMPGRPSQSAKRGGLIPLWMQRNNNPSVTTTPPSAHPDSDLEKLRRYSSGGLPLESFSSARSEATIGPPGQSYGRRSRSMSRGRTPDIGTAGSRSRSASRDIFNADRTAGDSMMAHKKYSEGEFGSQYAGVDTGYGARSGDRRSEM